MPRMQRPLGPSASRKSLFFSQQLVANWFKAIRATFSDRGCCNQITKSINITSDRRSLAGCCEKVANLHATPRPLARCRWPARRQPFLSPKTRVGGPLPIALTQYQLTADSSGPPIKSLEEMNSGAGLSKTFQPESPVQSIMAADFDEAVRTGGPGAR